jgi:hypothetical protein
LCFLGTEGNGMSDRKSRSWFRLGKGTVRLYKDRVVQAILDCLFEDSVKWPDVDERRIISERIRADFGLHWCCRRDFTALGFPALYTGLC